MEALPIAVLVAFYPQAEKIVVLPWSTQNRHFEP